MIQEIERIPYHETTALPDTDVLLVQFSAQLSADKRAEILRYLGSGHVCWHTGYCRECFPQGTPPEGLLRLQLQVQN